uniref:Protein Nef n=1 Tax=Human immunodeficiency virus 2 TaxID=11709 RepID=A0A2Z4MTJ5_9HIV2|nr:nef protein [Human immunodeficiency virus 2]
MGGNTSSKPSKRRCGLRERLLQARGENYGQLWEGLEEGYSQSRGELGKGSSSRLTREIQGQAYNQGEFMNTPWKNPAQKKERKQYRQQNNDDVDDDNDDLVGVPVWPRAPLRAMTYKLAINMSHFIKEKGGLEGMFYSERRHRILDTYLEKEEGIVPDWQNYTRGPGIRYPKYFGWLWQLEPVDVSEEDDETNCLVHPAQTSQWDDPWGETLVWRFNSALAYTYEAYIRHPEEFGWK